MPRFRKRRNIAVRRRLRSKEDRNVSKMPTLVPGDDGNAAAIYTTTTLFVITIQSGHAVSSRVQLSGPTSSLRNQAIHLTGGLHSDDNSEDPLFLRETSSLSLRAGRPFHAPSPSHRGPYVIETVVTELRSRGKRLILIADVRLK